MFSPPPRLLGLDLEPKQDFGLMPVQLPDLMLEPERPLSPAPQLEPVLEFELRPVPNLDPALG
jgi:hypothetical protein